ncbi:MAG: GNAT family N-acetyltransferase [Woeseia sp.]
MTVVLIDTIDAVDAADWNRLAGDRYPFLRHEFLRAAESSGCVAAATGWQPRHVLLRDAAGVLVGAMPLYEKTHSWGEFVFDWAWAQAYQQAGIDYYPKLISAIPFTPAPSPRLLLAESAPLDSAASLIDAAVGYAGDAGLSSFHVLFPTENELSHLKQAGLQLRKDCQFHWLNANYTSFEHFLSSFSSAKRKKVKRDRRHVAEQGIAFRWLTGDQTDAAIWSDVYAMISDTFLRRGSMPYFSRDFFMEVADRLPRQILVVLAEQRRQPVAAAVFYRGGDTLYGRYWGSEEHFNALHFETCYYQGIDYCIANAIGRFEPGTQGEHKISRGFVPIATWSAHWLAQPEFFAAVGKYLRDERRHVDRYMSAVDGHSPYRMNSQPEQETQQEQVNPLSASAALRGR